MPFNRLAEAPQIAQGNPLKTTRTGARLIVNGFELTGVLRSLLLLSLTAAWPAVASDTAISSEIVAEHANAVMSESAANPVPDPPARAVECSAKVVNNGADPNVNVEKYTRLSPHCKFNLFLRQTYSPYTFLAAGFQATLAQANDQWPHYGGGVAGYGKRFGATLTDTESRRLIQTFALSTILHQDPRYFPSHSDKLIARAWYAASRVVIGRSDDGRSTFNSPEFLGALLTSSLQNAYYPRHDRNFGDTMGRFEGAMASDATTYLLREFTPDIMRIFRRHTPEKIKTIERKLPIPEDDKL